ncbi:hypothetical protein I6U48_13610, partial [Clostridium sp. PL3]|nr:hypothetical protein [Clostridium thailandense]
ARNKIPELQKALKGNIKEHQVIMLRHQNEEKIIKKNIKSIESLGYEVVLQKT